MPDGTLSSAASASAPVHARATARVFQPADVRSLRDVAYDDIRDAILSGALRPASASRSATSRQQMGICTTPVKEALRRLEQEGLVVSPAAPRRGRVEAGRRSRWRRSRRSAARSRRSPPASPPIRLTAAELARLEALVADMATLTREMREPQRRVAGRVGLPPGHPGRQPQRLPGALRGHPRPVRAAAPVRVPRPRRRRRPSRRTIEAILAALQARDGDAAAREMLAALRPRPRLLAEGGRGRRTTDHGAGDRRRRRSVGARRPSGQPSEIAYLRRGPALGHRLCGFHGGGGRVRARKR